MNYLLAGMDLRYAVLDNAILPKISVGIGLNYIKGGVGGGVGDSKEISYDHNGLHTIAIEKPDVNLKWSSVSLDFKAQISKSILIVTPYLGLGGSYAWSSAGYSVDSQITHDGHGLTPADIDNVKSYLKSAGLEKIDIKSSGISSMVDNRAFNARLFGGFAINLLVFRLDLTGLYSFRDKNYGASFGFRFQV